MPPQTVHDHAETASTIRLKWASTIAEIRTKGYRIPGGAGPAAGHVGRSFTAGTTLLAKQTQRNNPGPLAILSAVYEGTQVPFELGVRIEAKYFGQLLSGDVARNLMRTMFVNKMRADKLANRPIGVPKTLVRKLGVLGAGMMGSGIAYAGAAAGMDVTLLDTTLARAEAGKAYSGAVLDKAVARGQSTREAADVLLARIHPTAAYGDLAGCQFVIEAVFESREVKAEVTRLAAAAMDEDAVFGSNTSTLPISGLAGAFARPANFIGTHFFSPVERMPLLELIVGEATSRATLARTLDLAEQLRKTPIVVHDSRGFFTSRTFGSFVKEGLAMLQEGVLPPLIENAARQAGMPVGPLAATDEVSLDITLKVYDQWLADGVQPAHEPALSIDLTRRMVTELGRSGKLAGAGFYEYPKEGKKRLWPGLAKLCPPALTQPDVEELKLRFLTIQAIEAARCVEEGVITDPGDADVGSILGIGYPAWTGGVLSYIDTQGLERFVSTAQRMSEAYGRRYEPSPWLVQRALESRRFHASM
ncbi:MAG: 3-hydroxyacyl-CoA dehydrogenase family protein [Burkholderiales bacterium]